VQSSHVSPKGLKQREQRRVVFLAAQLYTDAGCFEATICNIARQGLMVKCADPPSRGAFVELRCGAVNVVGQVMWSNGARFGLRSQDRIDMAALHAARSGKSKAPGGGKAKQQRVGAIGSSPAILATEEQSRHTARLLDWMFIALAGAAAAVFSASLIYSTFRAPMVEVHSALETDGS
jgi:hypothetical protein